MRVVPLFALLALTPVAFAASPTKPTLLELANARFKSPPLSAAEKELFTKTETGDTASALTNDDNGDNPANAKNWGPERVIRAECLVWLCTDPEAVKRVTFRGVEISGMRVDGKVDLAFAQIPFGLFAWKCAFTDELILRSAHLAALYLRFTYLKDLSAAGAKIDGDLFFRDYSVAEGAVELIDTSIGGTLDCSGTEIRNPDGVALNANRAKIGASTFLRDGFVAQGQVNFRIATIGGNLVCFNAHFIGNQIAGDPRRTALIADGVRIAGSVFLRDGFRAEGEINFLGGTIDRTFDCEKAELSNPNGAALDASTAEIGAVYFRNDVKAEGEVNLSGARIRQDLQCHNSQFLNANGTAFNADETRIGGSLFLRNEFKPDGGVSLAGAEVKGYFEWRRVLLTPNTWLNLQSAKVATIVDEEKSWPTQGHLFLDGFTYDRITAESPVTADARLRWVRRQPRDSFLPQPYEQLFLVLHSMGHEREARKIMIEKNRDHARYLAEHGGGADRFLSHEWWWYNVFGRLIGYGYAPSRAFFISLAWILIGYALFKRGYSGCDPVILPTNERAYVRDGGQIVLINNRPRFSEDYPSFNAFICSLESFTPLLKLDQSSNWAPNARRGKSFRIWRWEVTTGSLLRAYLWIHIIAGWVFTSLWVGAVTGLVKS